MDDLWDELMKGMAGDGTFRYYAPISFFEKADAPEGQTRRFGGIATTEDEDQEGERILQRGLDFDSYFIKKGWFNDNHGKQTGDIVGYPAGVQFFKKGERLPDGNTATSNLHWTEGYLLPGHPPADRIWSAGMALQKAGGTRRLGQSIEGKVLRRAGPDNKTIARALVRHVAITHCPVNAGSSLNFLAKALVTAEQETDEQAAPCDADKALTSSSSSGAALRPESLEREVHSTTDCARRITKAQAVDMVLGRYPHLACATAGRIVDLHLRGVL